MAFNLKSWEYSWNFPSNNHGQFFGIADSGVETFNGTPMKSLAREICQNSIDANLNDNEPTHLQFKTFEISPTSIPQFATLKDSFKRALDFWSIQQSKKAKSFFNTAIEVSEQQTICCLRISDFNTKGLLGSDEEYNSPWCNLTKSQGASDKNGSNGGSFGIGKFAPYACSAFRTVFYSTLDSDGVEAYQGVARLTSFKNQDGEITQGTGFYGDTKNSPVKQQYSLDPNYNIREIGNSGTDLYIIGFTGDDNWKQKMVASVLDGFLYAIYNEKLVVEVEDIIIDKENLPSLLTTHKQYLEENADEYYNTLTADEKLSPLYEAEIDELGKVSLRLMIQPNYHRRVAMVRKTGMKIMDKGNINGLIPFAGVLFIEGTKLNAFLRELENPQHTKWEIDRADNKTQAKRVLGLLTKFIKNCLDKLKNDDIEETLDPSVGEYLAADDPKTDSDQEKNESINDQIREIQFKVVTRSQKTEAADQTNQGTSEIDDENGDIITNDIPRKSGHSTNGNGGGHNTHGGDGGQTGNTPSEHKKSLISAISIKTRVICKNKSNGEYLISIVPSVSSNNNFIEIFMSAETQNYNAEVITAKSDEMPNLQIIGNRIKNLTFTKDIPVKILLTINYHDYCSMEVKAYGNKI